jgi:uncharacterized membrane protein
MTVTIILIFTGIVLGASTLGGNGWLAGGVIGFLAGQLMALSTRFKKLEREVSLLKQQKAPAETLQPTAQPAMIKTSQPAIDKTLQTTPQTIPPSTSNDAHIPLAEPLQTLSTAHESGLELSTPSVPETALTPQSINPAQQPVQLSPHAVTRRAASAVQPRPDAMDKLINAVRRFFTEGNVIVRIGMVVMFFGLSFLVKYASNQGLLPIQLRLAAVAAIAMALIFLGWKTRNREGGYGLVLQGGGVAALYLTIFAAARIYPVMPTGLAFALMFAVVIFGVALAVLQNAQVLALMATAGGFLAPILTSDGSGNHVALFGYYLLLNVGILAIAWFKTWRTLNWVGFIFTFVITSVWGILRYEPEFYVSTQPFLIAFFVLYLLVSILFTLKQPPKLTGLVDASLIFGLPLVGFGLQANLLQHTTYGLAASAIVLAVIYAVLARVLWLKYRQTHQVLIECFIALSVCFATLAIPLSMSAEWTSAFWALEATGLLWVGLRQQRLLPRVAGYALHVAAAISLLIHGRLETGSVPVVSGDFIGMFVLAISALWIAWMLHRYKDAVVRGETPMELIAMLVGWSWWLLAGFNELEAHLPWTYLYAIAIVFFAFSTLAFLGLSRWLNWQQLTRSGFWLLPLTLLWTTGFWGESVFKNNGFHPFQDWGFLAFAIFAVVQYRFLWRQQQDARRILLSIYHVVSAWFICCVVFWEASWWKQYYDLQQTSTALLGFACLVLPLVLLMQLNKKVIWPLIQHAEDYKNIIPAPLLFLLLLWFIEVCSYSGFIPTVYLPVLNPLDLAQLAAVFLVAYAIKSNLVNLAQANTEIRYGILATASFIWINVVVLRAIHHYSDVGYTAYALWHSAVVQMALSILWTVCALLVMNISRRLHERKLWLVGAGLLALVVLKLFTQDLTDSGTLARIVSFMVVGGLMLLIGYLSPIPTKPLPEKNDGK